MGDNEFDEFDVAPPEDDEEEETEFEFDVELFEDIVRDDENNEVPFKIKFYFLILQMLLL